MTTVLDIVNSGVSRTLTGTMMLESLGNRVSTGHSDIECRIVGSVHSLATLLCFSQHAKGLMNIADERQASKQALHEYVHHHHGHGMSTVWYSMTHRSLGEFEHLVLLAVYRLGSGAYGVQITKEIEGRTGRIVSQAAVYRTLQRLEVKRFIASRLGKPTNVRGGRAKRYFRIQPAGIKELRDSRAALVKMWDGVVLDFD